MLEQKVAEALDEVGEGWGPLYGIQVHAAFSRAVREANLPGVSVERPWIQGEPITASIMGSIRTDIVLHVNPDRTGEPVAIWDLKTGGAILDRNRTKNIRQELRIGPEVPVIELHAERGTAFKSDQRVINVP